MNHFEVGRWGEDLAVAMLQAQGYSLLERNWRPQSGENSPNLRGEIDAVMLDGEHNLVFLEVKTRSGSGFGHPFAAIGQAKSKKLKELVYAWRREHPQNLYRSMRIDAVAITGKPKDFTFEHLQAVA